RFERNRAELREVAADLDTQPLAQVLAGDRARRHPHGRLARGRAAATPVVADAVLLVVGVVGVPRPEAILDPGVVAGTLVRVLDQPPARRAGRQAFEHARQDTHGVGLLALGCVAGLAGPPAIEVALDVRLGQRHARGTAVHDAAHRRTVTLAERRDGEQNS